MAKQTADAPSRSTLSILTGLALVAAGVPMAYGGGVLAILGGSLYYLPAGITLVGAGILLLRQRPLGVLIYSGLYTVTLVWAVWEVGLDFWRISPRVIAPTALAIPVFLSLTDIHRRKRSTERGKAGRGPRPRMGVVAAAMAVLFLIGFGISALYPHEAHYGASNMSAGETRAISSAGDWVAYGRTNEGRRFAPIDQITKENVGRLKVAWVAHTGEVPGETGADENTPLQVGERLITCSPSDIIHALDAENGRVIWTFNPRAHGLRQRCRGVGYYAAAADKVIGPSGALERCRKRVVLATIDARLIEIDLRDGMPCTGFGHAGTVDLTIGLGETKPGRYFVTSAPTVANGLIVVGGLVMDGVSTSMPSGVVRAYDATSGALRWAWDMGIASDTSTLPGPSALYTRGTPNVWAPLSVDERLGLVYLPTGNPSPDHWGGNRTPAMNRFSSSVVALELATGKLRWSFQTTHHDLWDYDVPSQPTLYDMPDGHGGRVPALFQPTKRGEIFVLDRRSGKPLTRVEERHVPQGAVIGDRTSPTQPYSVGMPTISAPRIREADMWGISPLDQLWCRITFRKLRYEGDFTPPDARPGLVFPGVFGGMNWGSASVDEVNDYLIVNDIRIGDMLALVPRAEADRDGKKVLQRLSSREIQPGHGGLFLQEGAPYAAMYAKFMSPLGLPCNAPPFGTLTAIDLNTRRIAWQVPIGTTEDTGPLGVKMYLRMPVGLPTIGGSLVTRSGLIFFSGTQDFYIRAIDSRTGREIWKDRLPVGAGATPMTYIAPRSGRQFVIITASGSRNSPMTSDLVIAYALPH